MEEEMKKLIAELAEQNKSNDKFMKFMAEEFARQQAEFKFMFEVLVDVRAWQVDFDKKLNTFIKTKRN